MQLEPEFQDLIRDRARTGATVSDLIRLIRRHTGMESPGEGRLLVSAYLTRTFGMPLNLAAEVSGWVGFGDGDGQTTDAELDTLLGSYLTRA